MTWAVGDGKGRWFADPIHKAVHVDPVAAKLIDTVPFQRLRLVNQLSLMHYVFPGAEHSRFLHSLGVYKNMVDMLEVLPPGTVDEREKEALKVAALLHDVGHYPFSHLGEMAYQIYERMRSRPPLVPEEEQDDQPGLLFQYAGRPQPSQPLHEELGARMVTERADIQSVLESAKVDTELVAQLIRGESPNPVCNQLLHSALDADRLDYLLRDSAAAGVNYGLVDRDYLIRVLRIGEQQVPEAFGQLGVMRVLGVDEEHGLHALEHFVLARYFHYSQIVFHKTVAAFEVVARALIGQLIEAGILPESHKDIENKVYDDGFLLTKFHDRAVLAELQRYRDDLVNQRPSLGRLIDVVLRRVRPRVVYQVSYLGRRNEPPSEEYVLLRRLVTRDRSKLVEWVVLHPDHVGYAEGRCELEPDIASLIEKWPEEAYGPRDALRLVDREGRAEFAVANKRSILRALANYEYRVLRVFYVEPDEDQSKSQERYEKVRKCIQRYIRG